MDPILKIDQHIGDSLLKNIYTTTKPSKSSGENVKCSWIAAKLYLYFEYFITPLLLTHRAAFIKLSPFLQQTTSLTA